MIIGKMPSTIWEWGRSQMGANLIAVEPGELMRTLLPRTIGKFGRTGLEVNKMRYHCDGYTERYLSGGTVTVAYNPEDVSSVWVLENGVYTEFSIIESRFVGKDLITVQNLQAAKKTIVRELPEITCRHRLTWHNILRPLPTVLIAIWMCI